MENVDTRTFILNTAHQLIQRVGVTAMSYHDISQIVGIRKASIHYHFPSKDDLVAAVLDRYNASFFQWLDALGAKPQTPGEKLRRYCEVFETTAFDDMGKNACLYGMVGAELANLSPPLAERVTAFYQANHERLAAIIEEGQRSGEFKAQGDSRALAAIVFATLEGGLLIARAYGGMSQYQAMLRQIMQLLTA